MASHLHQNIDKSKLSQSVIINPPPHILIVIARFYHDIADELLLGASEYLKTIKATHDLLEVPGAFEIPSAINMAFMGRKQYPSQPQIDGAIALGCVIRGETSHYDYVCGESARGLQQLALQLLLPIGNGILTVENKAQAWERARRNRQNKGADAAQACVSMVAIKNKFFSGSK